MLKRKTVMVRSMISLNIVNTLFILFSYCRCVLRDPLSSSSITVFIQLDFARAKLVKMQGYVPLTCSGVHYSVVPVLCHSAV